MTKTLACPYFENGTVINEFGRMNVLDGVLSAPDNAVPTLVASGYLIVTDRVLPAGGEGGDVLTKGEEGIDWGSGGGGLTITLGANAEATRDATLLAIASNPALDSADGASTNIINLTYAASPIVLDKSADNLTVIIGTSATFSGTTSDGDTLTVGAVTYTFRDSPVAGTDIQIGGSAAASVTNAAAAIDGNPATTLVDGTDTILSINFVGPSAILETTSSDITLGLGSAMLFSDNLAPDDTLTIGGTTYTYV